MNFGSSKKIAIVMQFYEELIVLWKEKKNTMKNNIFLLVAILLISGCSSTGNLGIVAKSQVDPGSLITSSRSIEEVGIVRGKSCRHFILGIIPVGDSTVTKAIDNALNSGGGGDALINVSVTSSLYGFVPIYNVYSFTCTEVEGIAIKFMD